MTVQVSFPRSHTVPMPHPAQRTIRAAAVVCVSALAGATWNGLVVAGVFELLAVAAGVALPLDVLGRLFGLVTALAFAPVALLVATSIRASLLAMDRAEARARVLARAAAAR